MKRIHKDIKKVQITYGGGMGGSTVTGYAYSIKKKSKEIWEISFICDCCVTLEVNPRYIVYVQPGYDVYEDTAPDGGSTLYSTSCMKGLSASDFRSWEAEKSGFKRITFPY